MISFDTSLSPLSLWYCSFFPLSHLTLLLIHSLPHILLLLSLCPACLIPRPPFPFRRGCLTRGLHFSFNVIFFSSVFFSFQISGRLFDDAEIPECCRRRSHSRWNPRNSGSCPGSRSRLDLSLIKFCHINLFQAAFYAELRRLLRRLVTLSENGWAAAFHFLTGGDRRHLANIYSQPLLLKPHVRNCW